MIRANCKDDKLIIDGHAGTLEGMTKRQRDACVSVSAMVRFMIMFLKTMQKVVPYSLYRGTFILDYSSAPFEVRAMVSAFMDCMFQFESDFPDCVRVYDHDTVQESVAAEGRNLFPDWREFLVKPVLDENHNIAGYIHACPENFEKMA